jgi:hypothetical protein
MNRNTNNVILSEYWQGIHEALDDRLTSLKRYISHPTTGFSAEGYFIDLLREYLPKRYSVDQGFAVNSAGERSDLIDIIIADTFHIPPLCSEPNYKVFAIESVCAAIEVTTGPTGSISRSKKRIPKLEDDLRKLAKVRLMGEDRIYHDTFLVSDGKDIRLETKSISINVCPRAFLITSGNEWVHRKNYETNVVRAFDKIRKDNKSAWLNAALSMKHGMLYFPPHQADERRWFKENSLLTFLMFLNDAVTTYPTYRINLQRYRKNIPSLEDTTSGDSG